MKKILIVTPHFYPETFKCNEMAFELSERGYEVSVMTAIPDYPDGKFYNGYGILKRRSEVMNGVKIHRSLIVPRGNGSAMRLALNYLSYTFFAIIKAFWFGLTHKYDAIIVHETSPVMVGIPAVIIKKMQRIPLYFWVLDLWPESLSAAGGIKNKKVLGIFDKLTSWIYRNCNTILIGSKGYKKSICSKGKFDYKIVYFPNWVENVLINNLSNDKVIDLPKGFNVMIAGNMGDAQDIPHILETANILKDTNINFIFVGDGRKKSYVEEYIKQHNLQNKVFCVGRFPLECMPSIFNKADILLMALKDVPIFSLTVPSRLQAYMSSGKPIVAMINGEGADLIKDADCGWSVPAEDSQALAQLLLSLSKEKPEILNQKGTNGKNYSQKHFQFKDCIDKLEKIISNSKSPYSHN